MTAALLLVAACGSDDAGTSPTTAGATGPGPTSAGDAGASPTTTGDTGASPTTNGDAGASPTTTGGTSASPTTADGTGPVPGGTLTYAAVDEVAGWRTTDLKATQSGEDRGQLIYDYLLLLKEDYTLAPNIATEVVSDDGITWTMRLRPDVHFSDGTPLDADAVVFNWQWISDPEHAFGIASLITNVDAVRAVDPLTVEFTLKSPDGSFPYAFARLPGQMMSPTALQADPEGFAQHPVGAGPYLLDSWVKDSNATFVRNPDYWDAGKPYLDEIEVRIIPDATTRGQSLAVGEIDLAVAAAPVVAAVADDASKQIFYVNGSSTNIIIPNQDRAPFDDPRIREAVALALDPVTANDALLQSTWENPAWDCPLFISSSPDCVKGLWPAPDVTKARALVQEYTDEGGSLGTPELLFFTGKNDVAEFVQQSLRDIGIDIEITILPVPEWSPRFIGGDCDLCMTDSVSFNGPADSLYLALDSSQRHVQKGPVDASLDDALRRAKFGLTYDERMAAGREAAEIVYEQFLVIPVIPGVRALVGGADVHLGGFIGGGGLVSQEIWRSE